MEAEDVIHVRLHLTAIIGEAVITGMSLPRLQIGQIVARDMLVAHMNTMMVVIPHHILQGTVEAGIQGTTDHQTGTRLEVNEVITNENIVRRLRGMADVVALEVRLLAIIRVGKIMAMIIIVGISVANESKIGMVQRLRRQ